MTIAIDRWPEYTEVRAVRGGALSVCRSEPAKLSGQLVVRALVVCAVIGPFAVVAGLNLQSATPPRGTRRSASRCIRPGSRSR